MSDDSESVVWIAWYDTGDYGAPWDFVAVCASEDVAEAAVVADMATRSLSRREHYDIERTVVLDSPPASAPRPS